MLSETRLVNCDDNTDDMLRDLVLATYDFVGDDRRLRDIASLSTDERARQFDALRKSYPCRREFANTKVIFGQSCADLVDVVLALGFSVT